MSERLYRKRALQKLASPERLDQLMRITSARGWVALLALGSLLAAGLLWGVFAEVPTTLAGQGILSATEQDASRLEAVLYVSIQDSRRIERGMCARISPITAKDRGTWGKVTSVERSASTLADMVRTLESDTLAQSLVTAGKLVEIRVRLEASPGADVQAGTICDATIVLDRQSPIVRALSR